MAMPLRVEYPGAIYHVTCRMVGNWRTDRSSRFKDDADYDHFLDSLSEATADRGNPMLARNIHSQGLTPRCTSDKIQWVNVTVEPKNWSNGIVTQDPEHCECGKGTVADLPYAPLVKITSQAGVTIDRAWDVVFGPGTGSMYDYWITQFVEAYESPFTSEYTVEVSVDGEVCSTVTFSIVY